MTEAERFWSKVGAPDANGCWPWLAGRNHDGYGTFASKRTRIASRWSLEEALGRPLLDYHDAAHTCDNPPCVRPSHLWEATRSENVQDCLAKGRHKAGRSWGYIRRVA